MYQFSDEEFDGIVSDAIDSIPEQFLEALDNVVFLVEDEVDPELYGDMDSETLGIYDGVSLAERGTGYGAVSDFPDSIVVFKGPHERLEGTRDEIVEEIRKTVVHEVGHYFGMDEDRIEAMGYQ